MRIDPRIEAASRGDRSAAESLLVDVVGRVRNLVRYLSRDDEVDDIAQEALIAVARGLAGYRAEGSFEGWVDRVTARTVFHAIRKRRADGMHRHADLDALELAHDGAPLDDEYQRRRHALALLDRLRPDVRHVFVLHHVVEMSVPEIAAQLEIPQETVRSRLRLAKARMRRGADDDDALGPADVEGAVPG